MERKAVSLEVKQLEGRQLRGYGSIFENIDLGGDIVVPGAFADSLKRWEDRGQLPPMFWMHKPDQVPGKWNEIREDDIGLPVRGEFANTPLGDEVYELTRNKHVRGMSIGYQTLKDDYRRDGTRLIRKADLWEVSIVSLPMNPLAEVVAVKARLSASGEYVPTIREFEKSLRDVGCSQAVAKRIIAKVYEDEERDASTRPEDVHRDDEQKAIEAANRLFEQLLVSRIRPIKF